MEAEASKNSCDHGSFCLFQEKENYLHGCSYQKDGKGCSSAFPKVVESAAALSIRKKSDKAWKKKLPTIESVTQPDLYTLAKAFQPPWTHAYHEDSPSFPTYELMKEMNGTTFESVCDTRTLSRYYFSENSIKDILFWIASKASPLRSHCKINRVCCIGTPSVHEALQSLRWIGSYCGKTFTEEGEEGGDREERGDGEKRGEKKKRGEEKEKEEMERVPVSVLLDMDDRLASYFDDNVSLMSYAIVGMDDPSRSKKARTTRAKVISRLEKSYPGHQFYGHSSFLKFNIANCEPMETRSQTQIYKKMMETENITQESLAEYLHGIKEETLKPFATGETAIWSNFVSTVSQSDIFITDVSPGMKIEFLVRSLHKIALVRNKYNISQESAHFPPTIFFAPWYLQARIDEETMAFCKEKDIPMMKFTMLDFPIHFVENPFKSARKTRGGEVSPVKIFTNLPSKLFTCPEMTVGYRYCEPCERYIRQNNYHCEHCERCVSPEGIKKKHCEKCRVCVPIYLEHCDHCDRCLSTHHDCTQKKTETGEVVVSDRKRKRQEKKDRREIIRRNETEKPEPTPIDPVPKVSRRFKKSQAKKRRGESEAPNTQSNTQDS